MTENKRLLFDCHRHFYGGNIEEVLRTIETSPYSSKYMCYSSVCEEYLRNETIFNPKVKYFIMPFVLKEIDIESANYRLMNYTQCYENLFSVPLIGGEIGKIDHVKMVLGLKEHFLLHKWEEFDKRRGYYDWLNTNKKLLIIHCKDAVRMDCIKKIRTEYPDIYLQVAHLGVNRKNIEETLRLIEAFSGDDHVYFDVSTVFDYCFIESVRRLIGNQMLFGSDIPYINEQQFGIQMNYFFDDAWIDSFNNNAVDLLKKLRQ